MKNFLITTLLIVSTNTYAEFSDSIIGLEKKIGDKSFNERTQERLHQGHKEIILTFDDGPTPGVTNKVLDILKEKNIKATFFIVAENALRSPDLMKRILDEGHIVANHSYTHLALKDLGTFKWKRVVKKEVLEAHQVIVPYMGNAGHFYYRAPEGAWASKYANFLNEDNIGNQYIGPVLWDIGGELILKDGVYTHAADWACWSKKLTVDQCLSGYLNETRSTKGGVVLMHDLRSLSAEMLAKFIPALENEGYAFKTMDDVNWNR